VKALLFERSLPRFAAARVAGALAPGGGARVGPLRLTDVDPPELPGPGWKRVRPRLAGICGSDLATVDGQSSRYFEPIVSFPFVPGHEVVGELEDGTRVVVQPTLTCAARGVEPLCAQCA
jgi:threonine dehydrogenase-like Zn-dependent dehydrogenase